IDETGNREGCISVRRQAMSYMIRSALLVAFVGSLLLLWPERADAQQRGVIRDSVRLRPPITTLPNQRPAQGEWQLGVHADDTRTGMRITQVIRGSAAARAGLEAGDKILTVGTERVGLIGNRSVPMRSVLRRQ